MPWNRKAHSSGGIRNICRKRIMDDVFLPLKLENQWNLLIMDTTALDLISACFKTEEVLACNIAAILPLEGMRENLGYISAIYILSPSEESIDTLLLDFNHNRSKYKYAHLVFLTAVPEYHFQTLCNSLKSKWIETFVEMDMLFLPHESQVYSINDLSFFASFFDAYNDIRMKQYEAMATKLVTLFINIEKIPIIRYRRGFVKNLVLAEVIEREFNFQKSNEGSALYGKDPDGSCQLLILDRGFDCVTPIIHDFTFQAMVYDLLDVEDDLYLYDLGTGKAEADMQFAALTEDDALWCRLRHEHIANVSRIVQNLIQNDELMSVAKSIGSQYRGLPSLSEAMRNHLIHKRNESFYSFRNMANECMKLYCEGANVLAQLEQNLALGKDADDRSIKDPLPEVQSVLSNNAYTIAQKLRILMLYIFYKKGITREQFDDLVLKVGIPFSSACTVANLLHMDIDIFRPGSCQGVDPIIFRETLESLDHTFRQSRWTPLFKSILTNCVLDQLSEDQFPFLKADKDRFMSSRRDSDWCVEGNRLSHLVVFLAGGISYPEMRCAYEVMRKYSRVEIYVGGDALLTPNTFIDKLKEMRTFFEE